MGAPFVPPAAYGLEWIYALQVPEGDAARIATQRANALSEHETAMRRLEASDSPLLRDMAASLRQISGPRPGRVCPHGIDTRAGCGRCLTDDIPQAALTARLEDQR